MRCFQALLLPYFQYFQYFCNIFPYFQYIFHTFFVLFEYWGNESQNWAKNEIFFYFTSSCTNKSVVFYGFFSLKCILPRPKQNRWRIFILSKYFMNNLFLTVFVQNVISKFVKVLQQTMNNSLLEKSRLHFCAAAC